MTAERTLWKRGLWPGSLTLDDRANENMRRLWLANCANALSSGGDLSMLKDAAKAIDETWPKTRANLLASYAFLDRMSA